MADTEDVNLIMESCDISDLYSVKGTFNGRITALLQKVLSEVLLYFQTGTEYDGKGQETLIGIVIQKLSFHTGMGLQIDQSVVGVKEQAVFHKTPAIHGVGEGRSIASVKIEAFLEKECRGSSQKAGING